MGSIIWYGAHSLLLYLLEQMCFFFQFLLQDILHSKSGVQNAALQGSVQKLWTQGHLLITGPWYLDRGQKYNSLLISFLPGILSTSILLQFTWFSWKSVLCKTGEFPLSISPDSWVSDSRHAPPSFFQVLQYWFYLGFSLQSWVLWHTYSFISEGWQQRQPYQLFYSQLQTPFLSPTHIPPKPARRDTHSHEAAWEAAVPHGKTVGFTGIVSHLQYFVNSGFWV